MNKLPSEILNKIFIQLTLKQRLRCLTVCRTWWNVLDQCCLFYDLHLDEDKNSAQLHRFMEIFQRLPDRAFQVQEVYASLQVNTEFNKEILVTIFPNTRVMRVTATKSLSCKSVRYPRTSFSPGYAKSKVQHLSEYYVPDTVFRMWLFGSRRTHRVPQTLHCHLGRQLKSLDLDLSTGGLRRLTYDFSHLKDMPVLSRLALVAPVMKIDDLEMIHNNVPTIQDLSLMRMGIKQESNMPSNIKPATSITKFDIVFISSVNVEQSIQLYQYITKKYINVADVKWCDLDLDRFSPNDRKEVYLNGVLDFLKLIGPTQSSLCLSGLPVGVDPFEALDSVGSQIRKFDLKMCQDGTMYEYLASSEQSQHVQELRIINTGTMSIRNLASMTALTTLSIIIRHTDSLPLPLADCLAACPPLLKSLTIHTEASLGLSSFKSKVIYVENLTIFCDKLTEDLGDIISLFFPNLVNLRLEGDLLENVYIILKNPRFQKATIFPTGFSLRKNYRHGVSFRSPIQDTTRHYLCGKVETKPVQYDDIQDLHTLSILSVKKRGLYLLFKNQWCSGES